MDHHFNTEIAEKYGVGEAILLHNMCFWQKKNIANKNNYHDGKYWVYNSIQAYSELFPYYTDRQIRNILKKLEDKGCLYVGRYNKMKIDRTKWYSVNDEIMLIHGIKPNYPKCQLQLPKKVNAMTKISKCNDQNKQLEAPKMSNGSAKNVKPIPYINTDKNKDIKKGSSFFVLIESKRGKSEKIDFDYFKDRFIVKEESMIISQRRLNKNFTVDDFDKILNQFFIDKTMIVFDNQNHFFSSLTLYVKNNSNVVAKNNTPQIEDQFGYA